MLLCWYYCFWPVPACYSLLVINFQEMPYATSVTTAKSSCLLEARLECFQSTSHLWGASWKLPVSPLLRQSEYLSVVDLIQELSGCLLEDAFLCQVSTSQRVQINATCPLCCLVVSLALTLVPPLDLQRPYREPLWLHGLRSTDGKKKYFFAVKSCYQFTLDSVHQKSWKTSGQRQPLI